MAKIGVANEEGDEAVFWLEFVADANLAPRASLQTLLTEARALRAILAASYGTARANSKKRKR